MKIKPGHIKALEAAAAAALIALAMRKSGGKKTKLPPEIRKMFSAVGDITKNESREVADAFRKSAQKVGDVVAMESRVLAQAAAAQAMEMMAEKTSPTAKKGRKSRRKKKK